MGTGAWAKLNDRERDQLWSTYRKVLVEIVLGYGQSDLGNPDMRLLHVEEKGDTAEAICLWNPLELLVKLRFWRRNEVWHLVEAVQADTGLAIVTEQMQTTIAAIERVRAGQKPSEIGMSDFIRVLLLMEKDAAKSVILADKLLQAKPKDTGLRFLKAMALIESEKASEGEKLMRELSAENYAPAVYRLANYLKDSEERDDAKTAAELFKVYTKLEPYDSRGFANLGYASASVGLDVEAEAAYRKALKLDSSTIEHYQSLIELLVTQERFAEVKPLLAAGEKMQKAGEDLFGFVMRDMLILEEDGAAEKLAASEPSRMKTSALANLSLARMFSHAARYVEAERYFKAAALLDRESTEPPVGLAMLYRKQSRWIEALKAADKAISLDVEDSEGHYQRACALARLRRFKEAMASLTKAVELDPDQVDYMVDEEDLKPLRNSPEFKKLIPEPEKTEPEQPKPQPQF
jgi:tetratricopeptide (TPR) repeat protein